MRKAGTIHRGQRGSFVVGLVDRIAPIVVLRFAIGLACVVVTTCNGEPITLRRSMDPRLRQRSGTLVMCNVAATKAHIRLRILIITRYSATSVDCSLTNSLPFCDSFLRRPALQPGCGRTLSETLQ
jgi:hypothetical protein